MPLVAYVLFTLLTLSWIAWDAETIYVFDVFGKNLHYVWAESGKRWTYLFSYGWRLAAICALIASNAAFSFLLFTRNATQIGRGLSFVVLGIMLAGSFVAIPWIYVAQRWRWRKRLRRTASQLLGVINRVTASQGFGQLLQPADYRTREPWTAWHPRPDEWTQPCWSDIVPVAFFENQSIHSAVFCMDWRTFLAWRIPACWTEENRDLPFQGPDGCSFRVRAVRKLGGCPGWSVIRTELQFD